jgi:hypothetical protein
VLAVPALEGGAHLVRSQNAILVGVGSIESFCSMVHRLSTRNGSRCGMFAPSAGTLRALVWGRRLCHRAREGDCGGQAEQNFRDSFHF